ncbi:hypothetical protein FQN54_001889 [Arachnomyces sp. PD_36]|nr:hypothetical protein FQN54_001889 [Arachnomyces sp. PD_36]
MPKGTFNGGCICGAVRYKLVMDVPDDPPPTANRCNCTFCQKISTVIFRPTSPDDFQLLSPSSFDDMAHYQSTKRPNDVHRYFCGKCGVHVACRAKFEYQGQVHDIFNMNLVTIDQPQEGIELSKWKIQYYDGRTDNFSAGTRDVPWPSGIP